MGKYFITFIGVLFVGILVLSGCQTKNLKKNGGDSTVNTTIYKTIEFKDHKYHVIQPDTMMGAVATIVEKDGKALIIDTQFSNSDAKKIVDVVKEKKLTPKMIYISHSDPDYYFGVSTLKKAYPDVPVTATRYTVARIKKSYQSKLAIWKPTLKEDTPKEVVIPEIIYGKIPFEGLEFEIVGQDPLKTSLYNKKDSLLAGGISVSTGSHLFMADTPTEKEQQQWVDNLSYLESLKPKTVIPGHFTGNENFSSRSLSFTKNYVNDFIQSEKAAKDSQDLIRMMEKAYPNIASGNLELSAKVVKKEQEWDEEAVTSEEVLKLATETNPFLGKTVEVQFETGYHFRLDYGKDNQMTWTSLSGENKGQSETEQIYVHKLSKDLYTVNWIESTGISVSHNINLSDKTVWAYMSWNNADKYGGREVLVHGGTLSFND